MQRKAVRQAAGCASAASSTEAPVRLRRAPQETRGWLYLAHAHSPSAARVRACTRGCRVSAANNISAQSRPSCAGAPSTLWTEAPAAQNMNDLSNRRFQETVRTERPRPASRLKMHRLCSPADLRDRLFRHSSVLAFACVCAHRVGSPAAAEQGEAAEARVGGAQQTAGGL